MFITYATLNGFNISTTSITHSGLNKKIVEHNFINGTTPFYETTGVNPIVYAIEGFFVDIMGVQRQLFEQLVRTDTVVEFEHPQLGSKMVVIQNITTKTSAERVGVVDVSLSLAVTTQQSTSFSLANLISNPLSAVNTVVSQGLGSISSDFAGTVASSALAPVASMAGVALGGLTSLAGSSMKGIGGVDNLLNGVTLGRFAQVATLPLSVTSLVNTSQSNGNILSSLESSGSSYFSALTGSISSGVTSAKNSIVSLF